MFITEQQLEDYKILSYSKYHGCLMAEIVISEYEDFMKSINRKHNNIIELFEHFLHRKINHSTREYYFKDGSILQIVYKGLNQDETQKMYEFHIFYSGVGSERL